MDTEKEEARNPEPKTFTSELAVSSLLALPLVLGLCKELKDKRGTRRYHDTNSSRPQRARE